MNEDVIYFGDAVKAVKQDDDTVKLGGYLVRFGDPANPDLTGDYFTNKTDFGSAEKSLSWFNHRYPVKSSKGVTQYKDELPEAKLTKDETGVFAEIVLTARNEYERDIAALGLAGKLAWSSGTASHLVDRKEVGKGVYEITRWKLGLDASLTPTPAESRKTNQVMSIKSIEIQESKEMETPDVKALVEDAVKSALEAKALADKVEADKAAELKNAEEAGYKKAIEEVKAGKAPAYNRIVERGFSEEKDAVPAFKHWLQTGQVNGGLISPDSTMENIPSAKAAWNVTTGASGGFLVPDPLYAQIVEKRSNASWVRQHPVQSFSTPSDHLLVPREDTSLTNFTLTSEAAGYNEEESTVSQKDLILYKYTKLVKYSEEFMMYQGTNWESHLTSTLARAEAGTENTIYTTGTGTGQPEGILPGATVANTTATTDIILPAELTGLFGYLGSGYNVAGETGLLMSNLTKWYLAGQTGNPFLYQATPAGAGIGDFFHGYKNVVNDVLEPYTTASAKCILFGNFNYYGIVEKPGMMVQRNPYLFMGNGQVGIYASMFRGGGVLQSEAFYYLTNKAT